MPQPTIYLPLFAPNLGRHVFAVGGSNPGVGGTQFTAVQLAMLLSQRHPGWRLEIANADRLQLRGAGDNLVQHLAPSLQDYVDGLSSREPGVLVLFAMHLWFLNRTKVFRLPGRQVIWSHHPFDDALRLPDIPQENVDAVCVGEYQWHSNLHRRRRTHCIQGIFVPAITEARPPNAIDPACVRIVHLSSLDPSKGIVEIAQAWPILRRRLGNVRLDIVGGQTLYGDAAAHPLIPAAESVAERILRHIHRSEIEAGHVHFHGTLGEEKHDVIRASDFALLNPTGRTEAFPASPLDMMAMGVPVVGADDFGMADSMRFFPELSVRSIRDIAERSAWLVADPGNYQRMRDRAFVVARRFAEAQQSSLDRWSELIAELAAGREPRQEMRPIMKFHGSRAKLVYRRDVRPRLVRLAGWLRP